MSRDPKGQATAAALALGLAANGHPATNAELSGLFNGLVQTHRYGAADFLWRRLSVGGKARGQPFDGDFDGLASPEPFGWLVSSGSGATVEMAADTSRPGERALRVAYDGYSTPKLIQTFMALPPGAYRLGGLSRNEQVEGADRLGWTVSCADDGQVLVEAKGAPTSPVGVWQGFTATFEVPASGCQGQWLRLMAYPCERRTDIAIWYDKLSVTR